MRTRLATSCVVLGLLSARNATATTPADPDDPYPGAAPAPFQPRLDAPVGLGVGLDVHGGILALYSEDTESRGLVGATLRGRLHYFQAGVAVEQADSAAGVGLEKKAGESFRTYAGFVGVVIPFARWIDADASVGVGVRRYDNPSPRYGAKAFVYETPTLTWRMGVSDRTSSTLLGARVGGGIFGAVDLEPADIPWETTLFAADGSSQTLSGSTSVGGVTLGLFVTVGLEMGALPEPRKRN